MAINLTDELDENLVEYFSTYFTTCSGTNRSGIPEGQPWYKSLTSVEGIDIMLTDLVNLAEGLALNLNMPEPIYTLSGTAEDIELPYPETDTYQLYDDLKRWNSEQGTILSNYLYGKIIGMVVAEEPTYKLRKWFGLTQKNADIMWNLLLNFKEEDTNLSNAYLNAVKDEQFGRAYGEEYKTTSSNDEEETDEGEN